MNFICSKCGQTESTNTRDMTCICGGLWDLEYENRVFNTALFHTDTWSIFRYRAFFAHKGQTWRDITLGEGRTPIIPLDKNVLLKMDYQMPTLSFKDRGAAVLISHCKSIGVDRVLQDSSGNAGNSIAAYCGKAGIKCQIFVPQATSAKKISMIMSHGADVTIVNGSRDDCADTCREKARKEKIYYASHVYNPFFYEGTKTYIYEVFDQLSRIPKNIFIPLGNGTLFIGIVKALEHLLESGTINTMPQLFAVQSEKCAPIEKAYNNNAVYPAHINPEPTLAEGIAIGVPMRGQSLLKAIYKYGVRVITAPENGILEASSILSAKGIFCEHTTAATFAAYRAYCAEFGDLSDTLIPMCGAGLKSAK